MSGSAALDSEQFAKKLSNKVAAKLAAASATDKPSSNKTKKAKPEKKAIKEKGDTTKTDNKTPGNGKTNNAKGGNVDKKDFVKKDRPSSNKPSGYKNKDSDLKKEVGDLIDSLGFGNKDSTAKNPKKNENTKNLKKKGKKEFQNNQSTQQAKPKKNEPKSEKENNKDAKQKFDKTDKKDRANKRENNPNSNSDKPKGGALKEIDTIVTSLEQTFDEDNSSSLPPLTNELHEQNKPMFEPVTEWYDIKTTSDDAEISFPTTAPEVPLSASRISALHSQAKALLTRENELFIHEGNKSSSQKQFLSQLLTAGTLSDKISAYTLLVQESPLHSIKYLNSLLSLCRKKSRGNALQSIGALKDMFVNGVLPDRKLKYFKNQPTLSNSTPTEVLVLWAFEDWLKQFFFSLVQILEILSHDTVTYVRTSTVDHILDLLKSKPEQEANLLRLGVNKLGDKEKQVASRVSYLLLKIEEMHPAMNAVIASSVSELIFRPGSDYHARYYSIITLNQTILTHKNKAVANTLIRTYLSLFEVLLSESNRDKKGKEEEEEKPKKKMRHKHRAKGQQTRQTPVKTSEAAKEEEFDKLISAILTGMNRAYPFSDLPKNVFENHMNTIYRVTHSANFNTGVQALILLFQMTQAESKLSDRFYRTLYESLLDPRLAVSSKLRLYLNLMFKALKQDSNKARVKAFSKRLVQVANNWINIGIIAGVVFLVDELKKADPSIMKSLIDNSSVYSELAKLQTGGKDTKKTHQGEDQESEATGSEEKTVEEEILDKYDGRKRDPIFAQAENTKIWEIIPLLHHFHPTVAFYTQHYLGLAPDGAAKPIQPDLNLYTLSHFLDRFVYRNPKQKVVTRGSSIMQPLAGSDPTGLVFTASGNYGLDTTESGFGSMPVNVADWKNIKIDDVDAGDRFFYNYFNMVQQNRKTPKASTGEDDELDLDSEEAEKEIWKALVNSNPSIEDGGDLDDEDIDLSMSDMSDDDDDDDELAALQELAGDDDDDEDDDEDDDDEDDEAGFFKGLEDNDDALGSDDEVPVSDDENDSGDFESQFEKALAQGKTNKRTREEDDGDDKEKAKKARKEEKKERRKKLKELPLYASADDYAQYMSD